MSNMNNEKLNKAIFNPITKNPYTLSGANLPKEGAWATLKQWRDGGFAVRKGEHGTRVDWTTGKGEPRHYYVFHVDQCDRLETPETKATSRRIIELTLEAKTPEKPAKKTRKAAPEKPTAKAVKKPAKKAKPAKKTPEKPEVAPEISQYAEYMRNIAKRAQEIAPPRKAGFDPENVELTKRGYYTLAQSHGMFLPEWVDGYTFEYAGYTFGVAKHPTHGWKVSELGTGAGINVGKTRKDAIAKFAKLAGKVIEKLGDDLGLEDARVAIARAYEDATATDAAMGGR